MISPERPRLQHKRELIMLCDESDFDTGAFLRSTLVYLDSQDYVWFCQHPFPRNEISIDDINRSLELVPDEDVYPPASPFVSVVDDLTNAFVKRPKFSHLDTNQEDAKILPLMLEQEIKVLEFLEQNPHPKLVRYLGCTVKRDHITGIALKRHDVILADRFKNAKRNFDITTCIEDLRAGVKHLHSLGLAHNDLHPGNIALDVADRPVILDFGSCKRFGEQLLSAGTPGWAEEYLTSEAQHDEDAIEKIKAWLVDKC